ncbi:hypothetical protein [Nannocystis pusilla]|uniref:Pectate lyase superfamily protein domain-containing protein n=1 Tax=Nannocystis pusilla TaxID=889268 RepID=A0ABS7TT88_9BACT|nr:hypothetical protein [Nannocystis pusilla]MBZ5711444.1 hypothetical protein [Nannocystis pusilla]
MIGTGRGARAWWLVLATCGGTPAATTDTAATSEASGDETTTTSSATTESSSAATVTGEPTTTGTSETSIGSTAPTTTTDTTTGGPELGPPVLRINVGGPAVGEFMADDGEESPYRASPDTQIFAADAVVPGPSVPADVPLEVLASGRVEPAELAGGTGQLRYSVPVEPGSYQLRLHFSGPSQGASTRLTQLWIDGAPVGEPIDVSALTAGDAGAAVTFAIEADEWLDVELVRVPGSEMPMLSALELFGDGGLRDGPAGTVRHIAPEGAGSGDSLADAAGLGQLPALIAASAPGDEVWIHAGDYPIGGELVITAGGTAEASVVVRGVGDDWHSPGRPRFIGTRASPWVAEGAVGGTVFRLASGADHLQFVNLGFVDQGNGCWRVADPIAGLRLDNIVATNVHRLLENFVGGDGTDASIAGLVLKDVSVRGYARAVARLQYESHDALLEDVFGDSEAQPFESFSTGVTLYEAAHDVVIRRAVMLNHQQVDVAGYWNADGFSTERDNHAIRFEDTYAAGNTDGGYDLKSTDTTLLRAVAVDNKRNFRIWGQATLQQCSGLDPHLRGGSGTQAQVHGNPQAVFTVEGSRFVDADPDTIVFDMDEDAVATVMGGCAERHPDATLETVEPAASLMLVDVADGC